MQRAPDAAKNSSPGPQRTEGGGGDCAGSRKIPIAKLVRFQPPASKCQFGKLRGVVSIGEAFFDPLPK
jgi:hypothetical protein